MNAERAATNSPPGQLGHASRGVAVILERMTLDEWDALLDGDVTAAALRHKYLDEDGREQADVTGWSG